MIRIFLVNSASKLCFSTINFLIKPQQSHAKIRKTHINFEDILNDSFALRHIVYRIRNVIK